jgi:hypothetical protein
MTYSSTTQTAVRWQPWTFRDNDWARGDVTGYTINALDGEIGKVDKATYEVGGSYLIVDTGPWIFGHKVMLPAGVVSGVDHQNKQVTVERNKDQIKNAPELNDSTIGDIKYRQKLSDYYGESGAGWYTKSY